jgi:hypothetical protein
MADGLRALVWLALSELAQAPLLVVGMLCDRIHRHWSLWYRPRRGIFQMLKSILLSCGALALAFALTRDAVHAAPPGVTFRGTAQDCSRVGDTLRARHIKVSAFQVSRARPIKAHLDSMSQVNLAGADDEHAAFVHLDSMYVKLQSMVAGTKALARATSAVDGTFALTFSAVDSVLVVGYQPQEDQDFYYSSKVMTGRANRSFVLDMSRGGCGF